MKIEYLRAENILSYETLDVNLKDQGLVLITGENRDSGFSSSNGSGKSALLEPICWTLFGRTMRGITGNSIVRQGEKSCHGSLGLLCPDGRRIIVDRYRSDPEFGTTLLLQRDEKSLTLGTIKETQTLLEQLMGVTWEVFLNTVVLGEDRITLIAAATDKEQKDILESLLSLPDFSSNLSEVRKGLREFLTSRELLHSQKDGQVQRIEDTEEILQDMMSKLTEETEVRDDLARVVRQFKRQISNTRKVTEVDVSKESLKESSLLQEQRVLKEGIKKTSDRVKTVNGDLRAKNSEWSLLDKQQQIITQKIDDAQTLQGDCPVCLRPIESKDVRKITKLLTKDHYDLQSKISLVETNLQDLERRFQSLEKMQKDKESQLSHVEEQISIIRRQIDKLKESARQQESWRSDYVSKTKELERVENNRTYYIRQAAEAKAKLEMLRKADQSYDSGIAEIEEWLPALRYWEVAFGNTGIRSYVLERMIGALNKWSGHYSAKLTDSRLKVSFSSTTQLASKESRRKLSLSVTNPQGGPEYKAISKGEKARIDHIILFALRRVALQRGRGGFEFLALDEVLDNVDSIGAERLVNLLREEAKQVGTLLVVTHNSAFQQLFSKCWTAVKEQGISRLLCSEN